MAYYNICPDCGAHLDPGERCDCKHDKRERAESMSRMIKVSPVSGQYEIRLDKLAARRS